MTGPVEQFMIIGTRGSDLALTQTRDVIRRLASARPDAGISERIIQTTGDRRRDLPLAQLGGHVPGAPAKGVFIKELEDALSRGEIHAAVHSLKDLPSDLSPEFELAAILTRAPVEDVLVTRVALSPNPASAWIQGLPERARVATGSVRRACELKRLRPDLQCRDLRGNVPTRLRKLAESDDVDAIVLARAGLQRLGFLDANGQPDPGQLSAFDLPPLHFHVLNEDDMLPAAGQGAVAVECRVSNTSIRQLLEVLNDPDTAACTAAERAFLSALGAGCDTPVGAHAAIAHEGGRRLLKLRCRFFESSAMGDEAWSVRESVAEGPASRPGAVAEAALDTLNRAIPVPLQS